MKKLNKKGFTLVEMLVVIAIIAILVSILIPTVMGATKKAKAATDAANLRSALAAFQIEFLSNGQDEKADVGTGSDKWTCTDTTNGGQWSKSGFESKSVSGNDGKTIFIWSEAGTFKAGFGASLATAKTNPIEKFATEAEGKTWSAS
jgi:prepilin-type N-terminal cleavage/methylation domain-containing protein